MKRHKKGIALIVAIATVLTSGMFVSTPKTVHAEDLSGDGYLILENLEWICNNPDKDNLQIGDKFQVVVTVRNNSEETMTVDPALCDIAWMYKDYEAGGGFGYDGKGEKVVVKPGEVAKVTTYEVKIKPYTIQGRRQFAWIRIGTSEGYMIQYSNYARYNENYKYLLGGMWINGEEFLKIHQVDYDGSMDFCIPDSPETDTEAPVISSMTTSKKSVEPSGTVTYELEVDDYGYAPPAWIDVYYQDVDNEENVVNFWVDLTYSEEEGTYKCTFNLDDEEEGLDVAEGTYNISRVVLYDEAENKRYYDRNDNGILEDSRGNTLEVDDLVVEKLSYTLGDINADGEITMADLSLCLNHYVGKSILKGEQFLAADIDGNGVIEMKDISRMTNYIVGKTSIL